MTQIGMEFVTVACGELVGHKVGISLSEAVGMEEKDIAAITDLKQVRALIERWNGFVKTHRPLPNLMLYERGDRSEILLGTRA